MNLRNRHMLLVLAALAAGVGAGCDDVASTDDGGRDAGVADADPVDPVDGSTLDGGLVDAMVTITIHGTVFAEEAIDRTLDGGVTPWGDGGAPDGAAVTPGGRVIGVGVRLRTLAGDTIASATTDAAGEYTLRAPPDTLAFLHVDPVTGYAGQIRAEATRGSDYVAYDAVLPEEAGLALAMSSVGITHDLALGVIACGFNPVDDRAGGDGAELGDGVPHGPAFNLTDMGSILGNRLVPICESDGANPPGALAGATCTPYVRARQVFFPNVQPMLAPLRPLDPASGSCALRFAIDEWLVEPNSMTVVNIDCMP